MENYYLLIFIPLLSSLIGWFTNFLAVKMLFRPKAPKNFFGINFHGIIPKRRGDLAKTIGKTIEEELLTHGDLQDAIGKIDIEDKIRPIIKEKIDNLVDNKLAEINPMLMSMLPPEVQEQIKTTVTNEIVIATPLIISKLGDSLINHLPIADLVVKNINQFDLDRLEELIMSTAKKEFKFIEYLGGVVGLIIGLIQIVIMQYL